MRLIRLLLMHYRLRLARYFPESEYVSRRDRQAAVRASEEMIPPVRARAHR
jgi:hypothetical protein